MPQQPTPPPISVQLAIQGGGAKICGLLAAAEALQKLESDGKIRVTRIAGTSAKDFPGDKILRMNLFRERRARGLET